MNLNELFKLQAELDKRIVEKHNLQGQDLLPKKILALQVELGELANEWRGFKFWSSDQEPRTDAVCEQCEGYGTEYQDFEVRGPYGIEHHSIGFSCRKCKGAGYVNVNPLLEEYVDCLHFILSIGNDLGIKVTTVEEVQRTDITFVFNELFDIVSRLRNIHILRGYEYIWLLKEFINLSKMLGFTWEQVEQTYLEKNKINHERQANGY